MGLMTYYDGTVNYWGLSYGDFKYLPGENKICHTYGRMDEYGDSIFHIENGDWVTDSDGYYGLEDNSVLYDEDGNELPYLYNWNGADVTEEQYTAALRAAFDIDNAVSASAYWSYDNIMEYLQ